MRFYNLIDSIYEGSIFRPPSEANSLILQITIGCSHNKCTFCGTYREKTFRIKSYEDIKADVEVVYPYYKDIDKIFLADGNALIIPTPELLKILKLLYDTFPRLQRVGTYACPSDLLKKPVDELKQLRKAGLGIIYLGLESGSDQILKRVRKGALSKHMLEGVKKVKAAGMKISVIMILGLGGKAHSKEHAEQTGKVLSAMDPDYIGALTLMVVTGTEVHAEVESGKLELLEPRDVFSELQVLIKNLNVTNCIFRANHASNYIPVGGTFPEDKESILKKLDRILAADEVSFKPEYLRAL
ncbi:MAG: radical SAM protein [Thermoplasmata archaeon]|nr:radical SAM protein [Thermoplasmata archaeon]